MPAKMLLITTTFSGEVVDQSAFMKDRVVLGRGTECDVVLDNAGISRQHAEIVRNNDGFIVIDLGSSNGTYVNQSRVAEAPLGEKDTIQIGKFLLHTSVVSNDEASSNEVNANPWQRDQTVPATEV